MFYVLYPFVTYLLTLPRTISKILVPQGGQYEDYCLLGCATV
jgi:hypothetical protein